MCCLELSTGSIWMVAGCTSLGRKTGDELSDEHVMICKAALGKHINCQHHASFEPIHCI